MRTADERFWEKVDKSGHCWTWKGCKRPNGYGCFAFRPLGKHPIPAHRVAYWLTYGEFQRQLFVCHHCDNPPCVRPDHLFLGTMKDNMQDASRKGRLNDNVDFKGEDHPKALLTNSVVAEIKALYPIGRKYYIGPTGRKHSLGPWTQVKLAKKFNVSREAVNNVVNAFAWTHLPMEVGG